ncbi:MAG: hypothetical protein QXO51_05515 [Halobacteria archaeon]
MPTEAEVTLRVPEELKRKMQKHIIAGRGMPDLELDLQAGGL